MKHHLTCRSIDSSASNISYPCDMVWNNLFKGLETAAYDVSSKNVLEELGWSEEQSMKPPKCLKAETHDATGCCNKSPRVTCENHCRCDLSHEFKLVQLNSCDISQRQNKGKRLVAATVQTRRLVAATCRCDLSHRVSRL